MEIAESFVAGEKGKPSLGLCQTCHSRRSWPRICERRCVGQWWIVFLASIGAEHSLYEEAIDGDKHIVFLAPIGGEFSQLAHVIKAGPMCPKRLVFLASIGGIIHLRSNALEFKENSAVTLLSITHTIWILITQQSDVYKNVAKRYVNSPPGL